MEYVASCRVINPQCKHKCRSKGDKETKAIALWLEWLFSRSKKSQEAPWNPFHPTYICFPRAITVWENQWRRKKGVFQSLLRASETLSGTPTSIVKVAEISVNWRLTGKLTHVEATETAPGSGHRGAPGETRGCRPVTLHGLRGAPLELLQEVIDLHFDWIWWIFHHLSPSSDMGEFSLCDEHQRNHSLNTFTGKLEKLSTGKWVEKNQRVALDTLRYILSWNISTRSPQENWLERRNRISLDSNSQVHFMLDFLHAHS